MHETVAYDAGEGGPNQATMQGGLRQTTCNIYNNNAVLRIRIQDLAS